jgi:hypothetical protein
LSFGEFDGNAHGGILGRREKPRTSCARQPQSFGDLRAAWSGGTVRTPTISDSAAVHEEGLEPETTPGAEAEA